VPCEPHQTPGSYVPLRQGRNRPRRKILATRAVTARTSAPTIRKTHFSTHSTARSTVFTYRS
jgi:hypothetical protein